VKLLKFIAIFGGLAFGFTWLKRNTGLSTWLKSIPWVENLGVGIIAVYLAVAGVVAWFVWKK